MVEIAQTDLLSFRGILIVLVGLGIVFLAMVTGGWTLYIGAAILIVLGIISYVLGLGLARRVMRRLEGKQNASLTQRRRGGR